MPICLPPTNEVAGGGGRGSAWHRPPLTETPIVRDHPLTETSFDRDPLDRDSLDRDSSGQRPLGQRPPWTETPLTVKSRRYAPYWNVFESFTFCEGIIPLLNDFKELIRSKVVDKMVVVTDAKWLYLLLMLHFVCFPFFRISVCLSDWSTRLYRRGRKCYWLNVISIEFSLNCSKWATLAIKAYTEKIKINWVKNSIFQIKKCFNDTFGAERYHWPAPMVVPQNELDVFCT